MTRPKRPANFGKKTTGREDARWQNGILHWPPITHVAVSAASLLYCPNETSWKQFPGFGSLERIKSPNIQREDRFESPLGLSALEGISSDRGQVGGSDWNHSAQYRINRRCAALHAYESTNQRSKKTQLQPALAEIYTTGRYLSDRYPIPDTCPPDNISPSSRAFI